MTSVEICDKKEQLKSRAKEMLDSAKAELRKLTETEETEFSDILKEIVDLDNEMRKITDELNKPIKIEKRMKDFRLIKAINDIANNRQLDERALEVVNEGQAEMRKAGQTYSGQIVLPTEIRSTITAGTATAGQENVPEDKLNILEPLRARLVMVQAGANYMTGLVGDVSIPVYSGSSVAWKGEVASAADGAGTFSEVTLSPKRLTAYLDVSKQFLIQDSNSAEEMLRRDIINALAGKLESTILGSGDGKEGGASVIAPVGLFNGVNAEASALAWSDVVGMEKTLEDANVYGECKFILSPYAKAAMKTTAMDSGSGRFIMTGDEINGYKCLSTSAVVNKGMILGNFNDYVIGQWGGINQVSAA